MTTVIFNDLKFCQLIPDYKNFTPRHSHQPGALPVKRSVKLHLFHLSHPKPHEYAPREYTILYGIAVKPTKKRPQCSQTGFSIILIIQMIL